MILRSRLSGRRRRRPDPPPPPAFLGLTTGGCEVCGVPVEASYCAKHRAVYFPDAPGLAWDLASQVYLAARELERADSGIDTVTCLRRQLQTAYEAGRAHGYDSAMADATLGRHLDERAVETGGRL